MNALTGAPTGVICDDRAETRTAVAALLSRRGFHVPLITHDPGVLIDAVARIRPDLAVVALAACGARGLGVVKAVRDAHPGCSVVVLSPFDGLRSDAARLGALALIDELDLLALEALAVRVASRRGQGRRRRGTARTAPAPAGDAGTVTTNALS